MLPYQERVVTEKAELDDKISKLGTFILGGTFANLPPFDQALLHY